MITASSFGAWLRQERKAREWTQESLAERVGCSPATIRKIEAGERRPSRQIAELLAAELELGPAEQARFLQLARTAAPPVEPLPVAAAHLRPAAAAPSAPSPPIPNLPLPLTPLIGRERDIAALAARLLSPEVRLLTLTGSPGIGKTRLSIAAAAAVRAQFPDGVYFVAFAPISDPALVPTLIGQALGLHETANERAADRLRAYLRDQRLLLVLDNFEQVVTAAATVVDLLAACPSVKVLVTSREALHVRSERVWPVPPLAVPAPAAAPPNLAALAATPAVALFVERAQAVRPAFALSAENAAAVAAICAGLDGLPLAIEIAAARITLLSPQEIAARLDQRLKMLVGGPRDLPARHQTLRDAIGWSYDLLDAGEQRLFARLGVFVGSFTLAAVEAVSNALGDLPLDLVDGLTSLLDKSLLGQEPGSDGERRFRMLETIREYALERLAEGGEAGILRRRHAEYYLALAEAAAPQLRGPEGRAWIAQLEAAHDNLRAALTWGLTTPDGAALGLRLAGALWSFWHTQGHIAEGRSWLERALALPVAATPLRARAVALQGAGNIAWSQGDLAAARAFAEQSTMAWREVGDRYGLADAQFLLGRVLTEQGRLAEARALLDDSMALARELGDPRLLGWAFSDLGLVNQRQGNHVTARACFEEALALARTVGNPPDMVPLLRALADARSLAGDAAAALPLAEESLALARRLGDLRAVTRSLHNLAFITYRHGDYRHAAALFAENLELTRSLGDKRGIAWALNHLGDVVRSQGDYAEAGALYNESLALFEERGDKHGMAVGLHNLGYIAQHLGDLPQAAARFRDSLLLFHDLGYTWSVADALVGLAGIWGREERAEDAARLLGAADALHAGVDPSGALLEPANRAEWEHTIALIQTQLAEPVWTAAWTAGHALTLEEALATALVAHQSDRPLS
jgi:predicted ATPase/transcriptional regulator with XRE-family HTH domain/TolA-binding protein